MKKRKMKRLISLSAVFLLALLTAFPVFSAEKTKEYDLTDLSAKVMLPANMLTFNKDSGLTDPNFALAGVENPYEKIKFCQDNNVSLDAIAPGGTFEVIFAKKENDSTKSIYDLATADETKVQSLIDDTKKSLSEDQTVTSEVARCDINGRPYLQLSMSMTEGTTKKYELSYTTVVNGYSVAVNSFGDGDATEEQKTKLKTIVESMTYTIQEKPAETAEQEVTPAATAVIVLVMIAPFLLVALLILIPILVSRRKQKVQKERRAQLGERLIAYRREQQALEEEAERSGKPLPPEKNLFVNTTEFTDDILKKFCYFHCLRRRIISQTLSILVGAGMVVLCVALNVEFFLRALLFVGGGLSIGLPIYSPYKMTRNYLYAQRKAPSRTAQYHFREDSFRISGIQSVSIYPYFQITMAYETKDFFYLYFGDEHAYYVSKAGFSEGNAQDFSKFLKEKLGKYYKKA